MSYQILTVEIKNELMWVGFGKFEKKSMTTFTKETLEELKKAILEAAELDKKNAVKGLVFFSHKPGVFLAGVDISVINGLKSEAEALRALDEAHSIFNALDDLKMPTVALVDGICLGGGLELSLACKKIFISDSPKTALGLPEVMLGVLPGFGGTYRLPKKVGLTTAMDMILTGRQIRGKNALKMGLADAMLPTERMQELAKTYLLEKKTGKKKSMKEEMSAAAMDNFLTRKIIFQKAREKVLETSKGFYPAPLKILEVLESGAGKNRTDYLTLEAQAFAELSQSVQSKNLQHIFFLTDNTKKLENKDKLPTVKKGAVLGAGVMGGGIAWLFAQSNQAPLMKDITPAALELGLKQASQNFSGALKKRKMTEDEFNRKMRSIEPTLNFEGFKAVDLVVEAVVENMDLKKKVFAELEEYVRPDALLTSNTSSLSVEEMSKALRKPERFAGLHFFNPVNKMPLVEIITHERASKETIDSLVKWTLDAKKTPIVVKDGPGFLVNRILAPYLNEAAFLLEEGVSVEALDEAALNFGMPMGPCRLMDEIGLDVCVKVGKIMQDGLGARANPSSLAGKLYDAKLLGKKNSKGFYLYDEKGKVTGKNPDIAKLLPQKKIRKDEMEIQMRLFLPMVNEAAYIFADRIVDKASTVDVGMIYGTGFPPFRGGLCKWADQEGLDQIAERLSNFAKDVNQDRYQIAPFLSMMINDKKKFYDL
ncbi:3-hydroxyacyl-CoA dehydrogenase NAD-binding domain-containing protein [Peredibacter starrii]|uniref:enoyl-CoA hydratase n=1 Tax=Peredibacter starrii TaxID=28202 RepID=A0AAX4HK69_9BACT|nr:3-hydroxyacyl-CoA dehydrogenase NAD-binding domain-containing protein [Peredibacter starrii]WPU63643.1 3-hydroxyacyl-CoA dehydrogenase NAD-binding domain-containing protein [Peredibacter starrii]